MKRMTYFAAGLEPAGSTGEVELDRLTDGAEASVEFDPDELREFLAADLVDVPIDPAFKRRLRSRLWSMVKFRYGRVSKHPS